MRVTLLLIIFFFPILASGQFGAEMPINTITSQFPQRAVIEDFDGDGDLDAFLGDASSIIHPMVYIEQTDGRGHFTNPVNISTIGRTTGFGALDFGADGDMDIIYVNSDGLGVLENLDGRGNFSEGSILIPDISNVGQSRFHLTDMDGDGDLDVLTFADDIISVIENMDGAGTFGNIIQNELPQQGASSYLPADLDGDGFMDILAYAGGLIDEIRWFKNIDGAGTLGAPNVILDDVDFFSDMEIGDFDLDGDLEVLFSNAFGLYIFENMDGNGMFSESIEIGTDVRAKAIKAADMNNNGILNLLTFESQDGISIWQPVGSLGFFSETVILEESHFSLDEFFPIDIDRNGRLDFAYLNTNKHQLGWFQQQDTDNEYLRKTDIYGFGGYPENIAIADFDNDGFQDILYPPSSSYNDSALKWLKQYRGSGTFTNPNHIAYTVFSSSDAHPLDVDNDGDFDVVTSVGSAGYDIVIFPNVDGKGNFGNPTVIGNHGFPVYQFKTPDLNNDENTDILYYTNQLYWQTNLTGQSNFSTPLLIGDCSGSFDYGDLDGDGDLDVVVDVGFNSLGWYENVDGQGSFSELHLLQTDFWATNDIAIGDLNNDGLNDIVANGDGDSLFWWENMGDSGTFSEGQLLTIDFDDVVAIRLGDWDSDGDLDIVYAGDVGNDGQVILLENQDGSAVFDKKLLSDYDKEMKDIQLSDVNSDGDLDLVIATKETSSITWIENFSGIDIVDVHTFFDNNENATFDAGDVRTAGFPVLVNPNGLVQVASETDGNSFALAHETYEIASVANPVLWSYTTDSVVSLIVSDTSSFTNIDFGIIPNGEIHNYEVHLTYGPPRCGFVVPFWVNLKNTGNQIGSGTINFKINDPLITYVSADPIPDAQDADFIYWNFDNLQPGETRHYEILLQMPSADFIGEYISVESFLNVENMAGDTIFQTSDSERPQINCAYDPNDKLVSPQLPNDPNYTLFGEVLEYTIRFQNTGTDTALNVRVEDLLDYNLDWTTFEVLAASHDYRAELNQQGRVAFFFDDIYLPDSTTNLQASQGFVKYRIAPLDGLPEGTEIQNSAGIYFDFNEPILTNTTYNTLVSEYPITLSVQSPLCSDGMDGVIEVLDFPIENDVHFVWNTEDTSLIINNLPADTYHLSVFNNDGDIIADTSITLTNPNANAIQLQESICPTDSISIGDMTFNTPGFYDINLISSLGCDSLVQLELSYYLTPTVDIAATICEGESYSIGNETYQEAGVYSNTLTSFQGCDSLVLLTLSVLENSESTLEATICEGEEFIIGGTIYNESGNYMSILANANSCDSTVFLSLTVLENSENLLEMTICEGEDVQIGNATYDETGIYINTLTNANMCDSIVTLDLTVIAEMTLQDTIIQNDSGTGNGSISPTITGGAPPYTYLWSNDETTITIDNLLAGIYSVTVTDSEGCTFAQSFEVFMETATNFQNNQLHSIKISPNPVATNEWVTVVVDAPLADNLAITIRDIFGQAVYFENNLKSQNQAFSVIMPPISGMYLIEIKEGENWRIVERIIVY